jgi:hypothetical protein
MDGTLKRIKVMSYAISFKAKLEKVLVFIATGFTAVGHGRNPPLRTLLGGLQNLRRGKFPGLLKGAQGLAEVRGLLQEKGSVIAELATGGPVSFLFFELDEVEKGGL